MLPRKVKKCKAGVAFIGLFAGTWVEQPPNGDAAPECLPAQWTRDNHLGNAWGGHAASYESKRKKKSKKTFSCNTKRYNWTIPNRPSPSCVLRLRYNITTKDGASVKPFPSLRSGDNGIRSPVTQDPTLFHSPNTNNDATATA